jgi:exopolysaccharide production protein ExoQ
MLTPAGETTQDDRFYWWVAIFAVLAQQGAFVSSPALSSLVTDPSAAEAQANVFNTIAIAFNILLLVPLCLLRFQRMALLVHDNAMAIALLALIFISTAWSIHPDVTIRRSINYLSTMLTAFYLVERFEFPNIARVISASIAISVTGSFIFVLIFPDNAVHPASVQFDNLAGAWRGAFAHKNVLGHTMAVGILVELYLLISFRDKWVWHALLLCACWVLLVLSRSSTAIILSSIFLVGAALLMLLLYVRQYLGVGLAAAFIFTMTIFGIYWVDPDIMWTLLGRDATLTGRTELWALVVNLISERPLLGWGYSAIWLPSEPIATAVSEYVGWAVPHAHNAWLEITLELGFVGLATVASFVAISFWRSIRCLMGGAYGLGMISLVFFLGTIISGATESTLAQNQTLEWLLFNVLSFGCGLEIRKLLHGVVGSAVAGREFG